MAEFHFQRTQPSMPAASSFARRRLVAACAASALACLLGGCGTADPGTGLRTGGVPRCNRNGDIDERRAC
jgi:hypothetical protein